ncbi:glutamyl aminopeptidase-like [Liolophura sinensis]|uniref:glutamyl aminopeptidase-like n=1 Tax=Liolophura sinensis TaxID=3198878 RepID=UPI003158BD0D
MADSHLVRSENHNAVNNGCQDTIVTFRERSKGCYVTRLKAVALVLTALGALLLVALLAAFFGRVWWCPEDNGNQDKVVNDGIVASTPSSDQNLPISDKIRLPYSLIPHRYQVDLVVNLTGFSFSGSVRIDLHVDKSTPFIIFHRHEKLNVSDASVSVTDSDTLEEREIRSTFRVPRNQQYVVELSEPLKKGKDYSLHVGAFDGHLTTDMRGLYLSSYKTASGKVRYLAASQLQSTDARKVFPCFDEPHFKATFTVSITHQDDYRALGNMPVIRSQILRNGWIKTSFRESPVMSTYLLAFVVSDFKYREAFMDNLQIRIWAQPDMINQTEFSLDYAVKTYRFFTDYFGVKEVVPKTDHVAVPDFGGGAMENWGLVIYRETSLLVDPQASSSGDMYLVTLIVAHEIAHTWFGNMVTMKWWEDLWLNEGFASTLMFFAMDHSYPDWKVFAIMVAEDIFPVMVSDSLEASHPVSTPVDHPDDIMQSFDLISYNKGMAILRMLKGFLGWNQFRKGLQNYVKRYKFRNAEMRELWETFTETVNGSYDVGKIMDTWTIQMGYPVVSVIDEGNRYLLQQDRFMLNSQALVNESETPFNYKWYVPFTYITQERRNDVKIEWMAMGSAWINKDNDGWLLGNVNYQGFYRVNYQESMWAKLTKQLRDDHTLISQSNRAGLIDDALNLARAGLLDYNVALNVTTYLDQEESYVPWRAFNANMDVISGLLTTTETYGMLERYLKKLVAPVFRRIGVSVTGSLPKKYLRRIILDVACRAGVKEAVEYAHAMFRDWMVNGTRLPADYALTIYSVGIREGGEEEWNFLWKKSVETNVPTEKSTMLEALAQSRHLWILWRYVNWVFDQRMIDMQDVRLLFGFLEKNPVGRMVSRQFVSEHWEEFIRRFEYDWFSLREIIPHFTAYISSTNELEELERLYKAHPPNTAVKAAASSLALIRWGIEL